MEFTQVRTKAQEMLVQKDIEIKKLKVANGKDDKDELNSNNSGIEDNISDSDSDGDGEFT